MRTTAAFSLLTGLVTAAAVTLSGCGGASPAASRGAAPAVPSVQGGASPASGVALTAATGPAAGGTVTATGSGIVSGAPDILQISIGVQAEAAHATDALAQDNAGAASVQAALRHDGVAAADVQTGELSLYPRDTGGGNQVDGYQVSNTVSATLRDLGRAGQVIDDVVAAAGDAGRLQGVDFSFADTSPLRAQARQKAVAGARDEAAQMAAAAGEKLGMLVSLTDQSSPTVFQPGMAMGAATSAGSATSVPVQPGTQQLSVQVTGVWDLVPA